MNMIDRNKEAATYYELAHAILDLELGPYHSRTLTVRTRPPLRKDSTIRPQEITNSDFCLNRDRALRYGSLAAISL